MNSFFSGAKPASPTPASPAAAGPATGPVGSKKRSARGTPRVHDAATLCRIGKYNGYRATCSAEEKKQKESCEMVKKCKQHGVGSELWPVDVWQLDEAKFAAVNAKFMDPSKPNEKAVINGKHCMNDVMRADEKFVKEIEAACGPLEKKKSTKPPLAAAAKPAAAKPPSKKPASAKKPAAAPFAAKPASKKPVAAKPASKKPVAAKPASKK